MTYKPGITKGVFVEALNLEGIEEQSSTFTVRGNTYTAREPSEEAVKLLRSRQLRGARMVDGRLTRDNLEAAGEIQSYFVSLCTSNGDGKPVPQTDILKWPAQTVKRVSDWLTQFITEPEETEESLQKEIDKLQERLEKVRSRKAYPKD